MPYVVCLLIGYFLGGINPSYIIGKIRGFDIRTRGSGNAGASNAVITMGKAVGAFSAVFDIFKAFFSVKLAVWIFPAMPLAAEFAGVACILGHMFPAFMHFRGGKGLACLGGVILAYDWKLFLGMLAVELILALITDYICVVPMTACILYPILKWHRTGSLAGLVTFLPVTVAILCRHTENIKRIRQGTEAHLSFLWNRKREIDRLQQNLDGQTEENQE